jgi:hypothetical protein
MTSFIKDKVYKRGEIEAKEIFLVLVFFFMFPVSSSSVKQGFPKMV